MSVLVKDGVSVSVDSEGVARVTLDRPSAGNALDLPTATALAEAAEGVGASPAVRAVLLTGSGAAFCVGGDVGAMAGADDRVAFLRDLAGEAHRAILALATMRKPLVVAVNGAAAGAGLALTLQGDAVMAGESSRFVPAYLGIGLTPDCGLSMLLPEVVGLRPALDLLLNNRSVRSHEAKELGLVDILVPDDELATRALDLARDWARAPHPSMGNTRWLVRSSTAARLREHLDLEAEAIAAAAATPASVELVDTFARGRSRSGGV